MSSPKNVPQRTCVGCRTTRAKREFTRIVRTPEGGVEIDPSGKRNGRGAYLCADRACWQEALRKDRLARALCTSVAPSVREELLRHAEQFEPATTVAGS